MADFTELLEQIEESITTNGTGDIEGVILRSVLLDMVDKIDSAKLDCVDVLEDGLYIVDEDMNVAWSLTEEGMDAFAVTDHFKSLITG